MIKEPAARPRSLFRGMDPRALLLAAAGAAFCFSFLGHFLPSCLGLFLALVLAVLGRLPALPLLRHLAVANVFVLFIWLTVPATMPGDSVAAIGPLSWSREGVRLALSVTVKCNAILLAFLALVDGIGLARIGCALERLRVPAKLVFLFLFTCRYIHVIGEEWQRLRTAAELRCFVPRNSLHTYRTVGAMVGLSFVNAMDRSRRVYEAMLLRGFAGKFHTVAEMRSTRADVLFCALFFVALACLIGLDISL